MLLEETEFFDNVECFENPRVAATSPVRPRAQIDAILEADEKPTAVVQLGSDRIPGLFPQIRLESIGSETTESCYEMWAWRPTVSTSVKPETTSIDYWVRRRNNPTWVIVKDSATRKRKVSCWSSAFFLDAVYALDKYRGARKAIEYVIDGLDDALNQADFSGCEATLLAASPEKLSDAVIVAFLGITLSAKQKVAFGRMVFYCRAMNALSGRRGSSGAEALLAKYR